MSRTGERGEIIRHMGLSRSKAVKRLADALEASGYEVNRERKGWRVLMFRKNHKRWSQVWGSTKAHQLRVSGPEKEYKIDRSLSTRP